MGSTANGGMNPMAAGALSGLSQVLAEQPFDTIKVRMQSRALSYDAFTGPIDLVRTTFRREGIRAFFQGVTPRLATYSAVKASLFTLFDKFYRATDSTLLAGGLAGGINTVFSCPQDVLKSLLQVQVASGPGNYRGPIATARDLYASHGGRGFYRGWGALVARDVPGYALLYTVFVRGRASPALEVVPTWCIGGASGLAFYLSMLPVDRIKTVMMTQPLRNPTFSGPAEAWASIIGSHGVLGLYRGCAPTLARTFAGQGVALSVYEYLSRS